MALFLLVYEDGVTAQTDLMPTYVDACSWPKVIRIFSVDGDYTAEALEVDGWCEIPED